jgi:hypothetical protein
MLCSIQGLELIRSELVLLIVNIKILKNLTLPHPVQALIVVISQTLLLIFLSSNYFFVSWKNLGLHFNWKY